MSCTKPFMSCILLHPSVYLSSVLPGEELCQELLHCVPWFPLLLSHILSSFPTSGPAVPFFSPQQPVPMLPFRQPQPVLPTHIVLAPLGFRSGLARGLPTSQGILCPGMWLSWLSAPCEPRTALPSLFNCGGCERRRAPSWEPGAHSWSPRPISRGMMPRGWGSMGDGSLRLRSADRAASCCGPGERRALDAALSLSPLCCRATLGLASVQGKGSFCLTTSAGHRQPLQIERSEL